MAEVDARPAAFRLRLFGSPSIADAADEPVPGLGPGKPLALLAYLAVRGDSPRDELIELLWGGVPESRARNAFRQSLHRLRSALGDDLIPQGRDRVTLARGPHLSVDRTEFLVACDAGRWEEAVLAYGGEFLHALDLAEPPFEQWVENERMRLRTRYEAALRQATQQALDTGRLPKAIEFAQSLSTVAPFDDSAAILEATVLVAAGRQPEALASVRRFAARMRADMELPVSVAVRELTTRLERTARQSSPTFTTTVGRAESASLSFQGREDELARLIGQTSELAAQRGATVLVDGDAGIGKTRLVDEFVARMSAMSEMLFIRGRERTLGTSLPYASVAEALRALIGAPGVAGTSRHLLTEAARILPDLRDQFDLDSPGSVEDEGGRLRFFEGVAALVDSAAYEQPVCIILDDLQHASPATLDLIAYLSGRLQASPVLLVLIARLDSAPTATAERLLQLASRPSGAAYETPVAHIALGPLSPRDIEQLVREFLARAASSELIDVERVVLLANGRPLPALELARRALDGTLPSDVPMALRDILWARLQTASPSERRVFFAASLLQRSASLRLLAAAAHLPENATFDAALQLERLGLLAPSGTGFVAAHDATHTFVSEASGVAGRALLAGWAAEALSLEPGASDAELAQLYALAGRGTLAFRHARAAAFGAAAAGASGDAMRLASAALTFAPDDRARRDIETLLAALGARDYKLLNRVNALDQETEPANRPADDNAEQPVEQVESSAGDIPETPAALDEPKPPTPTATLSPARPVPPRRSRRIWWIAATGSVFIALALAQRNFVGRPSQRSLADSVVVTERGIRGPSAMHLVTGPLDRGAIQFLAADANRPPWIDSLLPPLVNATPSPRGTLVSVERMTPSGTDLFVIGADRRDTTRLTAGGGDDIALGWAPDGRALLVSRARTLSDGSYDADLFVYGIAPLSATPIDTASDRAVTEASWSPDGHLIAWSTRVGPLRQQEIFVARSDGSDRRNISVSPSDDYQIAWSPDGTLLSFTSTRNGSPHIFTYDLEQRRLWEVTSGQSSESHPMFSPDGKYLAFESTRDGDAAVYVTLPLGGSSTRITPAGRQFSLAGWRGTNPPYLDLLRILGPTAGAVGDTLPMSVLAVDQRGSAYPSPYVIWQVRDTGIVRIVRSPPSDSTSQTTSMKLVAVRNGSTELVVRVAGWRSDSITIDVGAASPRILADDFSHGFVAATWYALGVPAPSVRRAPNESAGDALYPNADLEWESGALSRATFELRQPISVSGRIFAPLGGRPVPAASLELSLVAAVDRDSVSTAAPQFVPLVGLSWNGESDRLSYSVGRESFSESSARIPAAASHVVTIEIDAAGVVIFRIDGDVRWQSNLRYVGNAADLRARLWLGGRATNNWGAFTDIRARQAPRDSR